MKLYAIAFAAMLAATLLSGCIQGGTGTGTPTVSAAPTSYGSSATPAVASATPQPGSEQEADQVLENEFPAPDDNSSDQELEQTAVQ